MWILPLCLGLMAASAEKVPDPQQLLDAAHNASDVSQLGSYVLTARVIVNPGDSKREQAGTLTISRDHELSRVELKINGKDEVQIRRNRASYIVPSQTLLAASGLIDFDRSWDPLYLKRMENNDAKYNLSKAHAKNIGEHRAWCFDKKTAYTKFTSTEKLCFDTARPVLLRRSFGKSWKEFTDYTQLGTQEYPQKATIVREHMAPIEATDVHIASATLSGELFKPQENAMESCANEQPPQPQHTPEPSYPERASAESKKGMVVLNVIVAKDGTVPMARSLTPDSYGFSESAEQTVRTWQFKPATCDGRAIAMEMNVEVNFNRF
ncbi:MAG: energy transducer TonB [Acidobacteriia bacterium]|nr:energy transducer TonB [Terriglobia bacterium]